MAPIALLQVGFGQSIFLRKISQIYFFQVSMDASMSEAFEDARSEIESCQIVKSSMQLSDSIDKIDVDKRSSKDILDDDDELQLPPLETFFGEITELSLNPESVSLAAELENDLFPSTPLTEDQLR